MAGRRWQFAKSISSSSSEMFPVVAAEKLPSLKSESYLPAEA